MNMAKLSLIAGLALLAAPAQPRAEELAAPGAPAASEAAKPAAAEASKDVQAVKQTAPAVGLVKGYRGTSVPISGDQLLFLKKGDRVDVLVTFDAKMEDKDKVERKEKITATILQNVVVINVVKPAKVDEVGAVEILLNPVEAQYAALSISQGKITITQRAPGDTELHPMEMASFRKLIK